MTTTSATTSPNERFMLIAKSGRAASMLAGAGLASLAIGWISAFFVTDGMAHFLHAYLVGFAFVVSLSLGALFFVLLHHLVKAGWSVVLRRLAEAMAVALPVLLITFLPILGMLLAGNSTLYEWNSAEVLESDALVRGKAPYLNAPFFTVRCLVLLRRLGRIGLFLLASIRSPRRVRREEAHAGNATLERPRRDGLRHYGDLCRI